MATWGLLSDVHGNLPALERALTACRVRGATRFAVLGDTLGRGDPDGCVDLLREIAELSVVGNRDLDWQERVSAPTRAYVLGLPAVAHADGFVVSHGDARLDRDLSTADVRRGFARVYARLEREGARVWFFGHSHYARVWRLPGPGRPPELLYDAVTRPHEPMLSLTDPDPAVRWAVNVGSVGLPFPGKGPASCAVYDAASGRLEIVAPL